MPLESFMVLRWMTFFFYKTFSWLTRFKIGCAIHWYLGHNQNGIFQYLSSTIQFSLCGHVMIKTTVQSIKCVAIYGLTPHGLLTCSSGRHDKFKEHQKSYFVLVQEGIGQIISPFLGPFRKHTQEFSFKVLKQAMESQLFGVGSMNLFWPLNFVESNVLCYKHSFHKIISQIVAQLRCHFQGYLDQLTGLK